MAITQLNAAQIEAVNGAGELAGAAAGLGGAAAIAGGLAAIPTPASPALAGFAVVAGVLGGVLGYVDSQLS